MSFSVSCGLDPDRLPAHVAIIMDGNGRWAKKRLMNRVRGHERGADVVREIVRTTRKLGIPALTLYAFSTENWDRPKAEVTALMSLLKRFLASELDDMLENNIRLTTIGQTHRMPDDVRKKLLDTMAATERNTGLCLNLALSYGGREEIVSGIRDIARKVMVGEITPDAVTEETVSAHLYTRELADPDLLIRTSGERRISNFLLWQAAYAEFFFTPTLWPDFSPDEFVDILKDYQQRDRRFGKVDETR